MNKNQDNMFGFIKKLFKKTNKRTPVELTQSGFTCIWPLTYKMRNNGFRFKQEQGRGINHNSETYLFVGGSSYVKR